MQDISVSRAKYQSMDNLKKEILKRGLKQSWLADKAGINRTALSSIVNGKSLPNLRTAQRIAKALEMTVDDLWPLEDADGD